MAGMNAQLRSTEDSALQEFATWVRSRFAQRTHSMKLFGSRARGEGDEASDLDVMVVIDEMTSRERREIAYCCADLLAKFEVWVSPLAWSTEHYELLRQRERRIVQEIDRDGIQL